MTCGIYAILNKVNGKVYVGQSIDIEKQWGRHKSLLRRKVHKNSHLESAWHKYGQSNFSFIILEKVANKKFLTGYEQSYKNYYDSLHGTYNQKGPVDTPVLGVKLGPWSEERKKKWNDLYVRRGKDHHSFGKKLSTETKNKISQAKKGKSTGPCLESTKRKISKANTGKKHSIDAKRRMALSHTGKKASDKTKEKMSQSQLNRKRNYSKGVSKNISSGRWMGRVTLKNKTFYLGLFDDKVDAHIAVSKWRQENLPYDKDEISYYNELLYTKESQC